MPKLGGFLLKVSGQVDAWSVALFRVLKMSMFGRQWGPDCCGLLCDPGWVS